MLALLPHALHPQVAELAAGAAALSHVPPGVEVPGVRAAPGMRTGRGPSPASPGPLNKCADASRVSVSDVPRSGSLHGAGGRDVTPPGCRGGAPGAAAAPGRALLVLGRPAEPWYPVPAPPLLGGQNLGAAL